MPFGHVPFENTKCELLTQDVLRANGVAFRTQASDLPGKPDIAIDKAKLAIFVHGCYWHNHGCEYDKSNDTSEEHRTQIARKVERDRINPGKLKEMGWNTLVVWECDITYQTQTTAGTILDKVTGHLPFHASIGLRLRRLFNGTELGSGPLLQHVDGTTDMKQSRNGILHTLYFVLLIAIVASIGIGGSAWLQLRDHESRAANAKEQLQLLQTESESLRTLIGTLKQERETARENLDPIRTELNASRSEYNRISEQVASAKASVDTLEARDTELRDTILGLETREATLRTNIDELDRKNSRAQDTARQAESQLSGIKEEITSESDTLRDLNKQKTTSRNELNDTYKEIEDLRSSLRTLRSTSDREMINIEEARKIIRDAETAKSDLDSRQLELDRLNRDISSATTRLRDLKANVLTEQDTLESTLAEITTASSRLDTLSDRLGQLRTVETDLSTKSNTVDQLKREQASLEDRIESYRTTLAKLRTETNDRTSEKLSDELRVEFENQLLSLNKALTELVMTVRQASAPPRPAADAQDGGNKDDEVQP